ncbi:MAG: inorganic phosphate transporter [Bacteroidales bacterium]|nr:MAG: inorganic phosphate transporter [Bacteroidales bacterium]
MDAIYLIIIIALFGFAISDLIIGVSNDAVNFLNSAIGSKAAPFRIIMIVAALGILAGVTFSNGMMEVARKGIFHPGQFHFSEIMIIFIAVMMTDILLLDLFNTFGLPTSTTVSIVFELLGAAIGIAIIKISRSPEGLTNLGIYINSGKALAIIAGILLSVIIAFTVGAIIQYISRIIFSFKYDRPLKYFGAIWGGIAITAIVYFILIKGARGSSFMSEDMIYRIKTNTGFILILSFIGWTLLLQIARWIFNLNILKFIVLVGTFALAMAFAGNDLVNFIGVPLAGYESYKTFAMSAMAHPDQFTMEALAEPVKTPTYFLLIAGIIMVVTLWISKKARTVTTTTLDLSRQDEGNERFESSFIARTLVRSTLSFGKLVKILVPEQIRLAVNRRFDRTYYRKVKKEQSISFDLIRASVNLVVASILIAIGTALRLPLSTTYVTFMVTMGTSLADRAWGRESAVYRITGVIIVIGGWFFTALSAFTVSFLVALIIYWTGITGMVILISLTVFLLVKTHSLHRKRDRQKQKIEEEFSVETQLNGENIHDKCRVTVGSTLSEIFELFNSTIRGLLKEDRKRIKRTMKGINKLNREVKDLKNNVHLIIKQLDDDSSETGPFYVQVMDYLREASHCLTFLAEPIFRHIDNNHPPLHQIQQADLKELEKEIDEIFHHTLKIINSESYDEVPQVIKAQEKILSRLAKMRKKQIKLIKREEAGTKNSELYFNIITETKSLLLHLINTVKAQRDFTIYTKENHVNPELLVTTLHES